jgi:hypothetical protein
MADPNQLPRYLGPEASRQVAQTPQTKQTEKVTKAGTKVNTLFKTQLCKHY